MYVRLIRDAGCAADGVAAVAAAALVDVAVAVRLHAKHTAHSVFRNKFPAQPLIYKTDRKLNPAGAEAQAELSVLVSCI